MANSDDVEKQLEVISSGLVMAAQNLQQLVENLQIALAAAKVKSGKDKKDEK